MIIAKIDIKFEIIAKTVVKKFCGFKYFLVCRQALVAKSEKYLIPRGDAEVVNSDKTLYLCRVTLRG